MKSKLLNVENASRTYALVYDKGEEVKRSLLEFVAYNGIVGAHLTAIGAFSSVVLGYFDPQSKKYKEIPVDEQVEVLSLIGNIAQKDGKRGCTHTLSWANPMVLLTEDTCSKPAFGPRLK